MKRNITDFNRGSQLIAHFAQMFAAGFKVPVFAAIAIYCWLCWYQVSTSLDEPALRLIVMKLYAEGWQFMELDPAKMVTLSSPFGGTFDLAIGRVADFPAVVRAWSAFTAILIRSAWLSALIFVPAVSLFFWIAARFGKNSKARKHQRGRKLATTADLIDMVKVHNGARQIDELRKVLGRAWRLASRKELVSAGIVFEPFSLGGVPWPWREEQTHAMLIGSTGTGKTVALMDVLDQVRNRGLRSIVFDLTGAYVATYYDPSRDTILHPLDARCPRWSIFDECRNEAEFMAASEALIPSDGGGDGQFWVHGARMLFTNMCKALVERDMATNEDLATSLMTADVKQIYEFVKDTPAAPMSSPDSPRLADSVRAVFNANAQALMYLPKEGPQFSIRDWVNEGVNDGAILFVSARYIDLPVCRQLLTLWLNSAVNTLMAMPTTDALRLWFLIDELGALHRLPALEAGMRTARNFGGAFVTGVHTQARLKETYGANAAAELSSLAKTKLILGNPDPETARWCSEIIGNGEVQDMNEGFSFSYNNARDSVNLSPERREVRIVMPEQIGDLDPLNGFICLTGSLPPAPVLLEPRTRPTVAQGFIARGDFDLVRGSKRRDGSAIQPGAEAESGAARTGAQDDGGKEPILRAADIEQMPKPPSKGRRKMRQEVRDQGLLDLRDGAVAPSGVPSEPLALQSPMLVDHGLNESPANEVGEPSEAGASLTDTASTGAVNGSAAVPNGARAREGEVARRAAQKRSATEHDALGGPDTDREPDLGEFGGG